MKKDTTDRILEYVISINTDILKIHSEMGYMKTDIKDVRQEMQKGFEEARQEMQKGFGKADRRIDKLESNIVEIKNEIGEINAKLTFAGETIFENHEKRIQKLENYLPAIS